MGLYEFINTRQQCSMWSLTGLFDLKITKEKYGWSKSGPTYYYIHMHEINESKTMIYNFNQLCMHGQCMWQTIGESLHYGSAVFSLLTPYCSAHPPFKRIAKKYLSFFFFLNVGYIEAWCTKLKLLIMKGMRLPS